LHAGGNCFVLRWFSAAKGVLLFAAVEDCAFDCGVGCLGHVSAGHQESDRQSIAGYYWHGGCVCLATVSLLIRLYFRYRTNDNRIPMLSSLVHASLVWHEERQIKNEAAERSAELAAAAEEAERRRRTQPVTQTNEFTPLLTNVIFRSDTTQSQRKRRSSVV
jgi:hypothetical protein